MRHFLLLAFLWLVASPDAEADTPITIVADEWPPFSGDALPNGGISLDVISAVLTRAGYEVTTQVLPWARIMDGSRNGDYDIIGSLFYDAEIAEYMTYGDPFFTTEVRFVRQAGTDHQVDGLESLGNRSIAVGDGFLYEESFDRADFLNKKVVTTTQQAIQMVAYGRVDLTLDSIDVLNHAMEVAGPDISSDLEVLPFVLTEHEIHMAVRNDLPQKDKLVADFNKTLADMRRDGTLLDLLRTHEAG